MREERWTLLETLLATVLGALVVKICLRQGEAAGSGSGWWAVLIPAVWVYLPLLLLLIRRRPLAEHGFSPAAWTRGAKWLLVAAPVILVPFAGAVILWRLGAGQPAGFQPERLLSLEPLWQLLLVAIPEELFFRGYVQGRLTAWSKSRPGTEAGERAMVFPILAGALLFAAAHLIVEPSLIRAAVFFPGLVFGWLRARSGGLLAPAGLHWLANLAALALGWGE